MSINEDFRPIVPFARQSPPFCLYPCHWTRVRGLSVVVDSVKHGMHMFVLLFSSGSTSALIKHSCIMQKQTFVIHLLAPTTLGSGTLVGKQPFPVRVTCRTHPGPVMAWPLVVYRYGAVAQCHAVTPGVRRESGQLDMYIHYGSFKSHKDYSVPNVDRKQDQWGPR